MSSEVLKGPTRSLRTLRPRSDWQWSQQCLARAPSSMEVVAPRLLTIKTTSSSAEASKYSFLPGRATSSHSRAAISREVPAGLLSLPGSPWIPKPSSSSPGAMRSSGGCPGMLQVVSEAPTVPMASAHAWPILTISSSESPRSAMAPQILWTITVPARPLRPVFFLASDTSSPTTIMSTFTPERKKKREKRVRKKMKREREREGGRYLPPWLVRRPVRSSAGLPCSSSQSADSPWVPRWP